MIMKKIFTLLVMLAATLGMQAQTTWTVAGDKAILGTNWDPTDATNNMVADGNLFKLVKTDVMLKAKSYEYKVCADGGWTECYGDPTGPGGNAVLTIDEDACYTVTFTFDPNSAEDVKVAAAATKTGEYVKPDTGEQTWTVAGVAEICGVAWDPTAEENDMTSTDGGKTFTWSKEKVALEKGTPYGIKLCRDHDWADALGGVAGGQEDDNYFITVTENGEYTVEITLNAEAETFTVTTTKTGEHEFGDKTWTICGVEALCGTAWDPANTDNDMEKVDDGEYELVRNNVELLTGVTYEYKVAANHAWTESYGNGSQNQTFKLSEGVFDPETGEMIEEPQSDGVYDVTFTFLTETKTLSAVAVLSAGIKNVRGENAGKAAIYNLQGQRVAAGFRGVAIQNGKKVVMK